MVEEKKKRGRPKKIVATDSPTVMGVVEPWKPSGEQLRNDLVISMVMGIINKAGTIKYDFAKDLFNTATQLAYDFGWMEKPKEVKVVYAKETPLNAFADMIVGAVNEDKRQEALANTPADIFRQIRGES